MPRPKRFEPHVYRFIQDNYRTTNDRAISEHLKIPMELVRNIRVNAGLTQGARGRPKGGSEVTINGGGEPLKRASYRDEVHTGKILRYRTVE